MDDTPIQQLLPPAPAAMQRCIQHGSLTWLDFSHAGPQQIAFLRDCFHFHPLHLEDIASRVQRPKLDDGDDGRYLLVVLHFPVFDEMARLSTLSEIDIFVGQDYLITVHDGKLRPLRRLVGVAEGSGRAELMGGGVGMLLYRIVQALVDSCFPMVFKLDQHLDRIESAIFTARVVDTVQDLSYIRRDLISLRRILRPNLPVLRLLASREIALLRLDQDVYFGDQVDSLSRLWSMLEEQKEIIEGLDATLGSLTSHRINQEMKTYTLISVTMLPLTLVASILGMNVIIPYADHPWALPAVLVIMGLVAGMTLLIFRARRWL